MSKSTGIQFWQGLEARLLQIQEKMRAEGREPLPPDRIALDVVQNAIARCVLERLTGDNHDTNDEG